MNEVPPGDRNALVASSRVLAIFAHADDETLLAGALVAKLVSTGHDVRVLCLAPGGGERTERMRNACSVLGVSAVETLRYAEGVMWPDEFLTYELKTHGARSTETRRRENGDDDQALTPVLATAPIGELTARIGGRISEFDPDLVVTHSRFGDYGHADHAAAHNATVRAFDVFADIRSRLYALDWPKFLVGLNTRMMKVGGRDIRHMGPDGRFDLPLALRIPRKEGAGVTIDVADMLGARRAASRWYQAEIAKGPLPLRMLERLLLRLQRMTLGKARLSLIQGPNGFVPGVSPNRESSRRGRASSEYL